MFDICGSSNSGGVFGINSNIILHGNKQRTDLSGRLTGAVIIASSVTCFGSNNSNTFKL